MQLYPHQVENINLITQHKRYMIGDDPGLGKTASTLLANDKLGAEKILIVCPDVAAGVWEREIQKLAPGQVQFYGGPVEKRRQAFFDDYRHNSGRKYMITTFALAKEIGDMYRMWHTVIVDEAHKVRNRQTNAFKKLSSIKSENTILLSGTPVVAGCYDMWAYLNLIDKKKFPHFWPWANQYLDVYTSDYGQRIGEPDDPEAFQLMWKDHFIKHKKKDVLKDLPDKIRQAIPVKMSKWQRKMYDELEKDGIIELSSGEYVLTSGVLPTITRLRQLLLDPWLIGETKQKSALHEKLYELVEEEYEQNRAVIVFTPFAEDIPRLGKLLEPLGTWTSISGANTKHEIKDIEDTFQSNPDKRDCLIVSSQSGSSFTATKASTAIFAGYDWTAMYNEQCEDRIHRIGQKDSVRCLYLVHEETIDEHILDIVSNKKRWADLALDPKKLLHPDIVERWVA